MKRDPHILLAAGGTAGHVYPALSVAEEMLGRGWTVSFAGTTLGREQELLRRAGFEPHLLSGAPFHRTTPAGRLAAVATVPLAIAGAAALLIRLDAHAVLGFGGYASVGPLMAARLLRRFAALVEPNVLVGKANRLLLPFVDRVYAAPCTTFSGFDDAKVLRTGVPIRSPFRGPFAPAPRDHHRVLVFGDDFLDARMPEVLQLISLRGLQLEVVHQGSRTDTSVDAHRVAHIDEVWSEYAKASLVIARAGAGTLAELAAAGRPAILVPLADAAEDHQTHNAEYWQQRNAAVVIAEAGWNARDVADTIARLLQDHEQRDAMAARARELAVPDAATRLVDDLALQLERR